MAYSSSSSNPSTPGIDPTTTADRGTASFWEASGNTVFVNATTPNSGTYNLPTDYYKYLNRDGFDLIWHQRFLQNQMASVETDINNIEQNANLSDTEKMFAEQMAMNSWSAISNVRTNMLKSISDTLKAVARNIA